MNAVRIHFYVVALWVATAHAQLSVVVCPPQIIGQKAVVQLTMGNHLAESIESARAICFLLDDKGKMVGQSTKWVIGGSKGRPTLEPKGETTFNFVITSLQPFTATNLTAKVSFTRVVLVGGKLANAATDVNMTAATPH